MRYLPTSSITLAENDIATGKVIKSKTIDDMLYAQGTAYAHCSANGSLFYLGDMETSETTYSVLNEGTEPGYQLDEWRPAFYPIRKMQDSMQVAFDETLTGSIKSRKNIDGSYYIVVSGYGSNCTASFELFPMRETCGTSLGGASSLSAVASYTTTLTFDAGDYGYKEKWVNITGMTGSVAASANITGYRAELEAKVTAGTGYMEYVSIEEAKKVNHSTYIDYLRVYGDEIIQPYPSGETISSWRNDGSTYQWTQSTVGKRPVLTSDPGNFSYVTFDGVNDQVVVSSTFTTGAGLYFAVAINPAVAGAGTVRYILDHLNGGTYASRIFLNASNQLQFASTHTAGTNAVVSAHTFTAGTWADVSCCIYPDPDRPGYTRKEIWVNGELNSYTYDLTPYVSSTAGAAYLGDVSTGTISFNGAMAMPVLIAVSGSLSGSFDHRDINGLNLSWRHAWLGI